MKSIDDIYNSNKTEIYKLYLEENKTQKYIASLFGLKLCSLQLRLRKDKIFKERIFVGRQFSFHDQYELNKDIIHKLYLENNESAECVARKFGVSKRCILTGLRRYGLVRTNKEALALSLKDRLRFYKQSFPESIVEKILTESSTTFIKQFIIPGSRYSYDFYIPESNKLVEVDGEYWHRLGKFSSLNDAKEIHENDERKNNLARDKGFNLIRLTDQFVLKNQQEVLKKIRNG